jgi:hypothetical protein
MLRLIQTIVIILLCQFSSAQEQVVFDTSSVPVRLFPVSAINKYKANPDFQYNITIEPAKSLWDRFWDWFWGKVGNILETEAGQNTFKAILITLAVGVLVFFILKLNGMSNIGLFGKKNREEALGYSILEDDIHSINFDEAIEQAVNDKNLRIAVRLLYLQTLKNLTDRGLISWQVNKTNVDYVAELNGNEHQQMFRNLTLQFEYNWYGDLPIEENQFFVVMNQFNQFNQKLS